MPVSTSTGLAIEYETHGDPSDPTVLLVPGLGGQLIYFESPLVDAIVGHGFHVVRLDNRDAGLSDRGADRKAAIGRIVTQVLAGEKPDVPYMLADMAADAVGVLDSLDVERAHAVGVSMGGMIVQRMAIHHADRLHSITSIMSTTGDPSVGQPTAEAHSLLYAAPPQSRDQAIDLTVRASRLNWAGHFDETEARRRATAAHDRAFDPSGVGRQLAAILADGDRSSLLAEVSVPTLVIHGEADPLIEISGGRATADAIPGAEFHPIPTMGHHIPDAIADDVVGLMIDHFRQATP